MADNSWLIGDNDVTGPETTPVEGLPDEQPGQDKPTQQAHAARQASPTQQDGGIMALLHAESEHDATAMRPHQNVSASPHGDAEASVRGDADTSIHGDVSASPHDDAISSTHDDAMVKEESAWPQDSEADNPWALMDMPPSDANTSSSHEDSTSDIMPHPDDPWRIDDPASSHGDENTSIRGDANASIHEHMSASSHQNETTQTRNDATTSPHNDATTTNTQPIPQQGPAPASDPWVGFDEFSTQLDPWGQASDTQNRDDDGQPDPSPWDMDDEPPTAQTPTSEKPPADNPVWGTDIQDPDTQPTTVFDTWQDGDGASDDPWGSAAYTSQPSNRQAQPTYDDTAAPTDDMGDYADEDDSDDGNDRKPIIIAFIAALILALFACGGYAGYSMYQSHQRTQAAQQAEQSRKQHEFEADTAYKDAQAAARKLIATIKESAYKDDQALQKAVSLLETQANTEPANRDAETVEAMTDKLEASTSQLQHAYDQLVTAQVDKLKTRRDTLVKTADGLDAPAGEGRDSMLKLADTLRNANITADNQADVSKQCDDLESLIAKNKKAKEEADKKAKEAKEEQERKKAEEEAQQQAEQQAQQQYTPPQQQYTPQPQYTPQYTPAPQPQTPQQPSGGGPTFVPDTDGGNDASDM